MASTENTYEIGTVVELRSGSPKMTVIHTEDGETCCTWYCNNDVRSWTFPTPALRVVDESDRGKPRLEHAQLLHDLVLEALTIDYPTGEITGTPIGSVEQVRAALEELDKYI